jgi:hypothetical protein
VNQDGESHLSFEDRNYPILALLLISTVVGSGCNLDNDFDLDLSNPVRSTKVATTDMDARIFALATESGTTRVSVFLEEDRFFGDIIVLAGSERLEASLGGSTQTLKRNKKSTEAEYFTIFDTTTSVAPVQVRFFRADGTIVDPPVVFLRPDFTVSSPVPGQATTFMDDLLLEWTPEESGASMRVQLTLACTNIDGVATMRTVFAGPSDDDGSALYDLSRFPEATDPMIDQAIDCMLDVEFERINFSSLAPPFASGEFSTKQSRTIEGIIVSF